MEQQSTSQVGRVEIFDVGPERRIIATDKAPAAVGPYSQAVRVDNSVFTAGQIAIDPATGALIEGDIAAQTRQVLQNLSAVLEAAGSSLDQVIKTTVYLADMDDFAAMNEVYAQFFSTDPPARSTVQVARLPLEALVEIEAVAVVD
ncbi:MAG: RidA family protein [Anaerolineae bacterium]